MAFYPFISFPINKDKTKITGISKTSKTVANNFEIIILLYKVYQTMGIKPFSLDTQAGIREHIYQIAHGINRIRGKTRQKS